VPVGTGDEVERLIRESQSVGDVVVACQPEFLAQRRSRTQISPTASWSAPADERGRKVLQAISYRRRCSAQPGAVDVCDPSGAPRNNDHMPAKRFPRDKSPSNERHLLKKSRRARKRRIAGTIGINSAVLRLVNINAAG